MTDKELVERIARDGCEFITCEQCPLEKWCKDFWSAKALAKTWLKIQKEREGRLVNDN